MISTIFLGNKNLRLLLKEIEYFWFNNSRSKRTEDIRNKKIENSVNIWKKGNSINPLGIPKKKSRTEKITDKIIKKLKNTIKDIDIKTITGNNWGDNNGFIVSITYWGNPIWSLIFLNMKAATTIIKGGIIILKPSSIASKALFISIIFNPNIIGRIISNVEIIPLSKSIS